MTLTKCLAVISLIGLPAIAQIQQPQLGYMLDSGGALRPVFGMAASATLGDPAGDPALAKVNSFACSSTLCIAKTDSALTAFVSGSQSPGASSPTLTPCDCPGPALIALDPRSSVAAGAASVYGAWIYFQAARQLARWQDGALMNVNDFSPGGEILSLRAAADGFDYAVARGVRRLAETVWIEHYSASDGSIAAVDALGSAREAGAVMLFDGGVLISATDRVTLRRPNGHVLAFPLAGAHTFQAAGNGYVEVATPEGMWILRTDPGSEQLSLLPGVPSNAPARVKKLTGAIP